MGTLLLSACCALALNVQSVEIKKDTIDKYVIDKQVIERFNGTQLEGKTISKYIIAYKDAGKVIEKTHVIMTENKNISFTNGSVNQMKYEGLVVVDNKEMETNDISHLKADEIASMEIYKADSKVAKSFGDKGKNGVLMIVTKAGKAKNGIIYFIDGKKVEKDEVDKLSPDKIASMNVNKKEGNSVVEIMTKK